MSRFFHFPKLRGTTLICTWIFLSSICLRIIVHFLRFFIYFSSLYDYDYNNFRVSFFISRKKICCLHHQLLSIVFFIFPYCDFGFIKFVVIKSKVSQFDIMLHCCSSFISFFSLCLFCADFLCSFHGCKFNSSCSSPVSFDLYRWVALLLNFTPSIFALFIFFIFSFVAFCFVSGYGYSDSCLSFLFLLVQAKCSC